MFAAWLFALMFPLKAADMARARIDVLVVYTGPARVVAGSTARMVEQIESYVAFTNECLARSGVAATVNLVGTREIDYPDDRNGELALVRLRTVGDGYLDDVLTVRDALGADLIGLITSGAGGGAYLPSQVGAPEHAAFFQFGNHGFDARDAFAHELGHCLGAGHQLNNPAHDAPFEYAHGLLFQDQLGWSFSVNASYPYPEDALSFRAPLYSSPLVFWNGVRTGIADRCDNARAFRVLAPVIAAYRPEKSALIVPDVPVIVRDPEDSRVALAPGVGASFFVLARGHPEPSIQWQRSADAGASWLDLVDGADLWGARTASLSITGFDAALDGTLYRAVVSNGNGRIVSGSARLGVGMSVLARQDSATGFGSPSTQWQISPAWQEVVPAGNYVEAVQVFLEVYGQPGPVTVAFETISGVALARRSFTLPPAFDGGRSEWFTLPVDSLVRAGDTYRITIGVSAQQDEANHCSWSGSLTNAYPAAASNLSVLSAYTGHSYLFRVLGRTVTPPSLQMLPVSRAAQAGERLVLTSAASGNPAPVTRWLRNGMVQDGAGSTLTLADFQPAMAGIYSLAVTSGSVTTRGGGAVVGLATSAKLVGAGEVVGDDIVHANGNVFDQVLVTGAAEAITADLDQITRTSFIDLDGDIVQVEFSGPGTLSVVLEGATSPALPANYNQTVQYVTGHAGIVVTGATERTNLSVFTVGRATAVNQALFKGDVNYDGFADIAFIAIQSGNGRFGGLRTANTTYFASRGFTGLYAPEVIFEGPVYLGDITAFDQATPVLIIGGASGNTWITGGDLHQDNGRAVQVGGLTQLQFKPGSDSHGNVFAGQANRARLEQNGTDVTAQLVVNP